MQKWRVCNGHAIFAFLVKRTVKLVGDHRIPGTGQEYELERS
jgi:hypothetical protein